MPIALTALRSTIASALSNDGVWSVFSFPPTSPIANSVIVSPDDPYLEPTNNHQATISPMTHFRITMLVPLFDNQGNLSDIESFMVAVFNKLASSGLSFTITSITAPTVSPTETGQMLMSDLKISILTTWS
jgi:hypothetical protein